MPASDLLRGRHPVSNQDGIASAVITFSSALSATEALDRDDMPADQEGPLAQQRGNIVRAPETTKIITQSSACVFSHPRTRAPDFGRMREWLSCPHKYLEGAPQAKLV
jgi:hypothetical protein